MIKKIAGLALVVLITLSAGAQMPTSFPTEKDKFLKAIEQMMKASKSDNLMQADDDFNELVKKGEISDAQLQQIIPMANTLATRNLSPAPYYLDFFTTINAMAKSKLSPDRMTNWLNVCGDVIKNQKKGDNKELQKYLEFSIAFYLKGCIFSSSSKSWSSDAKSYTLAFENGKATLTLPVGKLTGRTTSDTLYIMNTSGKFIPSENKWYGKGGKVDWTRNRMNPNSVYAYFKSDYVINLESVIYSVDSVEFYYKDFFQTPLYGRYTDKFVSGGNDSSASYPRFDSWARNITLKEVVSNANYVGGFGLWGPRVMGFGVTDTPAHITFFKKDKTRALTAYSQSFTIKKGEEIGSPKAEVMIFNGNDTIYHPELNLTYKAKNNEVRMLRGESGISKSKFFDSYHNHEFEVDAIFWNLDSTRMQLRTLNGVGQVGSNFESNNYFNKDRIRKLQGSSSYEPLSIIKKMYERTGSKDLNAAELAKAIDPHLTEEQAKALYYMLVEGGFVRYDEPAGIVTMRDKVINYVMSNSKKVDYDIIRIKSVPKDGTDYIDLKNNNVELKGVQAVPISDTASVVVFPANKTLKLQKDRDMEFDGLVYGGRLDFFGKNYKFDYAPFTIDLNGLDSMRINIPDGNKLDENGQPQLITLLTDIVGVKGLLEVDAPINKSGRTRLMQFPKLTSKEKSYAYYEDPHIGGGAYKRKDFFFEIDPFKLDSLNAFTPSVINWSGKLVSGGIFPDIKNKLHIMPDHSLGFDLSVPDEGYALYKDGSKYYGDMSLNHKGLSGKGKITHLTSLFTSQDIMFYPDSLRATADTFHIAKAAEGVKTPEVSSAGNVVFWKPKSDSMMIAMKDKPFAMYENQTSLKGNLLLRSSGLRGNGLLDWKEANLSSNDFQFKADDMAADTAAMNIKSIAGDKVTFKTPNVSAKIDFKNRIGDFKSNLLNTPTEFAYNNFKTNIREFKWFIDQKILDFKAPPSGNGEYFTSTRESQKGLQFLGKRATYNLETSILRVEQVPYIYIADAKVVPDSGVVVIQGEAKIDQLKKATIFVDTLTSKHKIENCSIDIISKAELRGSGTYKYSCKDHKDQLINFNDIKCTKETIGEKKKDKFDEWSLIAKGDIAETDTFFLYPKTSYKGEAYLFGKNTDLYFKGFAKINFKNPAITTSDFKIVDDVNPDKYLLHYDSATRSSDGTKIATGIYFNGSGETPTIYPAVFSTLQSYNDASLFHTSGAVTYNEKTNEYLMGDIDKVTKGTAKGNLMRYNDDKGIIKAEGIMNLGADLGVIRSLAVGNAEVDFIKRQYTFNLTFGLDMQTGNKALEEKLQMIMFNDNTDVPDINYETDRFKTNFKNLADEKVDEKLLKDMEVVPTFKRPKGFDYNLVFSDVNFIYDPDDLTIRSYGKIGLAMVGEKSINKRLEGYIEIGLKSNSFNIYLKTGANEWFFFEYRPGNLGLISSYDDYNRMVGVMTQSPPEKRKVTGGTKGQFYVINLGSSINKSAFLDAMKEKSSPLLPQEKIIIKPKVNKDSLAKVAAAQQGASKPAQPGQPAQATPVTKADSSAAVAAPASEPKQEKEKPKSAAERRAEKLKAKMAAENGGAPSPSPAVPADTSAKAPAATDTTKKAAPVPVQAPPVKEEPKQEVPKTEPTPAAPVKEEPKTEAPKTEPAPVQAAPVKEEPKTEAPKTEPAPVQAAPVKEEPKQEAPKTEPVPVQAPPVKEEPKTEAPKAEPVPVQSPPVKEETKQEAPKTEPAPTSPAPVKEEPKTEAPKTEPVPAPAAPAKEEPKTETPKAEPAPVQAPPVKEEPKQEAPKTEPAPAPAAPVKEEPKTEAPKTESAPVQAPAIKEEPKIEAPKTEPAPAPAAPTKEEPKTEAPKTEPAPVQAAPVKEEPKQEAPKTEPAPVKAAPIKEEPKTEAPKTDPTPAPATPVVAPSDTTAPK